MYQNGAGHGQWPWMLKTQDITLYLSRGKWNGVGAVRLSSPYLWSCTCLSDALVWVDGFLAGIFGQEMHLQPSEIHLCADVAGWTELATLDRRKHFVSRSRKRGSHFEHDWAADLHVREFSYGLQETGFDFSKRGAISCTIYDKTREIKQSGKEWFADIWRLHGWLILMLIFPCFCIGWRNRVTSFWNARNVNLERRCSGKRVTFGLQVL
jgi:hypothetical protein